MAIFSRGKRDRDNAPEPDDAGTAAGDEAASTSDDAAVEASIGDAAAEALAAEPVPHVGISMSTFGKAATPPAPVVNPRPQGPELAPTDLEWVPGLRDNGLVREAVLQLSTPPTPGDLLNVARQLLQGHLFLRVKGNARALLAEGKELPLAVATVGDKRFALVYSGGKALQAAVRADGDADTSAVAQPILAIVRHVLDGGFAGIIIDQASEKKAVIPRELLEKVLEKYDQRLTVKTLLAAERTDATAPAVGEALTSVPLWVAVGKGPDGKPGLAEGRSSDGSRYLELYTHPLEVAIMGRGNSAAPLTGAQLAKALAADTGLTGVIIDPAGPWITVDREALAPVIALADAPAS